MIYLILNYLRDFLRPQYDLLLENIVLRQQILVLERQGWTVRIAPFSFSGRIFWVLRCGFQPGWKISRWDGRGLVWDGDVGNG